MKGVLRKQADGWTVETPDGTVVDSGDYPLVEDEGFIEEASKALIDEMLVGIDTNNGKAPEHASAKRTTMLSVGQKPYRVVDER